MVATLAMEARLSEADRTQVSARRALPVAAACAACWLAFAPAAWASADEQAPQGVAEDELGGSGDVGAPHHQAERSAPALTEGGETGPGGRDGGRNGADGSKPYSPFDLDGPMSIDDPLCGSDAEIVA